MSLIVSTVARWLKGFLLLFGIYLVVYGHLTPGGGFSGGVIVACVFILLMLADGAKVSLRSLSTAAASVLDSVGALAFLAIAVIGIVRTGIFFRNFIETRPEQHLSLVSAGTMPLANISIGLKVGTSVFLVFAVLAATRVALRKNRSDGEQGERK